MITDAQRKQLEDDIDRNFRERERWHTEVLPTMTVQDRNEYIRNALSEPIPFPDGRGGIEIIFREPHIIFMKWEDLTQSEVEVILAMREHREREHLRAMSVGLH